MIIPKKQQTKTIKQELYRMIQGALFGQGDEHDEYLEPNDSESSNDNSDGSFEPVESIDQDVTSESAEADATAVTQPIEAVEALEEVVAAAATETVESIEIGASDSSATDDSFDANLLQATSAPFVGAWQALVSQTNWEKAF
jgi:C-terminal processing protease CtpA/Prc